MAKDESPKVKAYYKSELANLYGRSLKTFNAWIQPHKEKIGIEIGKSYTPAQVKIIFECLGEP